jgi:hypothetical protein
VQPAIRIPRRSRAIRQPLQVAQTEGNQGSKEQGGKETVKTKVVKKEARNPQAARENYA